MSTAEDDNNAGLVTLISDPKNSNALVQRETHSLVSASSPLISRGLQQLATRSHCRTGSQLFQGDRGYLDVSPYGTVVTHSMDGNGVEVFDVQNPAKAKVLRLPACEWPVRFSWSHDGSRLVVGSLNAGMLETTHALDLADDRYLGVLGDSFVSETPFNEGSDRYSERMVSAWGWGREYGENKGIAWAPTGEFVGITEGWHKAPLRLWHLTGKSVSFVANFDFEQSVDDIGLGHLRFVGNNRLLAVPPVLRPRYLVWLEVPSLQLAERIALPGTIVRSTIIDSSFSADGKQAFFCTGAGAVFVLGTETRDYCQLPFRAHRCWCHPFDSDVCAFADTEGPDNEATVFAARAPGGHLLGSFKIKSEIGTLESSWSSDGGKLYVVEGTGHSYTYSFN